MSNEPVPAPRGPKPAPFAWFDPRSTVGRLLICTLTGLCAALVGPPEWGAPLRSVAGWDVATVFHLSLVWFGVFSGDAGVVEGRAAEEDPGRRAVWILVLLASIVGLVSAVLIMHSAELAPAEHRALLAALSFWAVISAWAVTHTAFTLRYAHLYYDDDGGIGGLDFPGGEQPDDFDFAYFSFTVGMTFQVSDVGVSRSSFRRWVLAHSVLSFAYNTTIVALAINLLADVLR
ncbi:MAG: DUF1345 domain-containing protein [Myxococcales bacterium]